MATDTFVTDRAVERHDTLRELANAGIEDVSLRDEVVTALDGAMYTDPLSRQTVLHDLDDALDIVTRVVAERIAQWIEDERNETDTSTSAGRGVHAGLHEAARIARTAAPA